MIITGTPPGVALGMKPQFLKAGDVVTLGIQGLGEQRGSRAWASKGSRL
jgi:2-keto-4-pentenoate hydratase/2-oxohepta-3-ene-1,7-dioic acid hydratase in catechol pathway